MNRWVRAALISVLAIGTITLTYRRQEPAPAGALRTPAAPSVAAGQAGAAPAYKDAQGRTPNAKAQQALSYFRVRSEKTAEGAKVSGASYKAEVTSAGLRMESQGVEVALKPATLEIGTRTTSIEAGTPSLTSLNRAEVARAGVTEQFVFENGRVEQLFRIDQPVKDEVRVRIAVAHNQEGGRLAEQKASAGEWRDTALQHDGVVLYDQAGQPRASYHSAKAIDATGRELAFVPRIEKGEIVLAVPADFMASAAYPVLIDPWLELNFSASGGGVSISQKASEGIAMFLDDSGNPYVAWSDNSSGNFEIYLRYFNGFEWTSIAGSDTGGGISDTPGASSHPSIAFDNSGVGQPGDGFLAVAWDDNSSGDYSIYVKVYDGTGWNELADSATQDGISGGFGEDRHPQVVWVGSYETISGAPDLLHIVPLVVWERARNEIQWAFFWTGDVDVEGPFWHRGNVSGTFGGTSETPKIAQDSNGRPFVVWSDTVSGNAEIYARAIFGNGTPFVRFMFKYLPTGLADVTGAAVFTLFSGNPWQNIVVGNGPNGGGISGTADPSLYPSIAVDPVNASAYVAWQELTPAGPDIHVRRALSGVAVPMAADYAAWAVMGASNISVTGSGRNPSIAVHNDGVQPAVAYVAWQDDDFVLPNPQNPEIFVAQSNGGAWTDLGDAGSRAASRGISATNNFSYSPIIQTDSFGQPVVAWVDGALGAYDVYLRKFYVNEAVLNITDTGATGLPAPLTGQLGQYLLSNPLTPVLPGDFTTEQGIRLRGILKSESAAIPGVTGTRLQIELRPLNAPFIGTQILESNPQVPAFPSTTNGVLHEVIFYGLPNVQWTWRARAVDQYGRVSPWASFATNGDSATDFEIRQAVVLPGPSTLQQFRLDGATVIGLGATSPENAVVVSGNVVPPNASLSVRLEVEVQPVGTGLTGTATATSASASAAQTVAVTHPVLPNGSYHWAARVVASDNTSTAWTEFGGNPTGVADFILSSPAPAALDQRLLDGTSSIPLGGISPEDGASFFGTVTSPVVGQTVALEVEVKTIGQAFDGLSTVTGGFVASGATSSVSVTGLVFNSYHWRARTVTSTGTTSAWVDFGTNANGQTDFQLFIAPPVVPVDDDKDKCGLLGLEVLLALGVLALRRRRS